MLLFVVILFNFFVHVSKLSKCTGLLQIGYKTHFALTSLSTCQRESKYCEVQANCHAFYHPGDPAWVSAEVDCDPPKCDIKGLCQELQNKIEIPLQN